MTLAEILTLVSTVAAAISAGAAAWQIHGSRRESQRRTVFEHLRELERRHLPVLEVHVPAVQKDLLEQFKRNAPIDQSGHDYLSFLNALDLLAFARQHDMLDRDLADEYLRSIIRQHVVSVAFLDAFQDCCEDAHAYEHLHAYLEERADEQERDARQGQFRRWRSLVAAAAAKASAAAPAASSRATRTRR